MSKDVCLFRHQARKPFVCFGFVFCFLMQCLLCMTKLSNLIWKRLETCYLCYTWLHHDHAHCQTSHLEVFENSTALVKTLRCVGLILIFTLQWGGEAGYRADDHFLDLWNIPSKAQKSLCTSSPSQAQTSSKFCHETGLPEESFIPSVNQSHQASPATRQNSPHSALSDLSELKYCHDNAA